MIATGHHEAGRTKSRSVGLTDTVRVAVAGIIVLTMIFAIADEVVFAGRILPGVRVGPVDAGWMSRSAAARKLLRNLAGSRTMSIAWTGGTRRVRIDGRDLRIDTLSAADSAYEAGRVGDVLVRLDARLGGLGRGFEIDVDPRPTGTAASALDEARRIFRKPAVDAHFALSGDKVQVVPAKSGSKLDERGSAIELADAFLARARAVHLPVVSVAPKATAADARRLSSAAAAWSAGSVRVAVGTRTAKLSPAQVLLATVIRDRRLAIDPNALEHQLGSTARAVRRSPSEARFDVGGNRVRIVGGRVGTVIDMSATARRLTAALNSGSRSAIAAVRPVQPEVTRSDMAAMRITKLLSTYTTQFNLGQDGRDININLAARAVRGKVLAPGETFSLNGATGPRNRHTGYKEALVFSNGKVVPGVGGGVCQVSSTLYEAALFADLRIVKRYNHSMAVSYIPPGRDATTFYPTVDLEFQNSRDGAILLWCSVKGNRLTMQVYGSGKRPRVTIRTFVRKTTPPKTRIVYDAKLPSGVRVIESAGRPGYIVSSYRIVWQGKRVLRREFLATDKYLPKAWLIRVGT